MPLKPALSRQAGGLVTIQEQRDGFRQVGRQPFAAGNTFRWGCAGIEEMESLSWARLAWAANEDTRTWDETTEPAGIQPWPQCRPGHLGVGERGGHCQSVPGTQWGRAGEGRQFSCRIGQLQRRGATALPESVAVKRRKTPATLPTQFSPSGKCTSHPGFGLVAHVRSDLWPSLSRESEETLDWPCERRLSRWTLSSEKARITADESEE